MQQFEIATVTPYIPELFTSQMKELLLTSESSD